MPDRNDKTSSTAGQIVAATGLIALDVVTGGVVSALAAIPGGPPPDSTPSPAYLAELAETTAPPQRLDDGRFACTGCGAAVPFEAMSLDEHGYFCVSCARRR